jgi:TRAP-type mannitol/chloroaromatic compound transport system permease small subunit
MQTLFKRIADGIDRINAAIARAAMWCALFMVVAEFTTVVMRYAFGAGSIALQEAVLYAQAALFLLSAAWTLQIGGHVRIDVFYAQARPRRRALVDLFGALVFLIPFAVALAVLSIPYAARSWGIFEHSREASGLPFVYLLKSLIPLFAVLIGLQGVSQAFRAAMVLIEPAEDQPLSSAVRGRG